MRWFLVLWLSACGDDSAAVDAAMQDGGADSGLPANQPPIASFVVTRVDGPTRGFDASASSDPDGAIVAYRWEFGDGGTGTGETAMHGFEGAGCFDVTLTVEDDRGATATATATVSVSTGEPGAIDFALDPLPRNGALLPRDVATNQATIAVSGTIDSPGWEEVVVRVTGEGAETERSAPVCEGAFSIDVPLVAELVAHDLAVVARTGDREEPLGAATDLVAGDVFLVQGQSNAVANQYSGSANGDRTAFLRSFGSRTEDAVASVGDDAWHRADGDAGDGPGAIGQWALRMAALLAMEHGVPIAILNGARGGQPIEYFARDEANHANPATNYGRLFERTERAGLSDGVRAILFYQGESDGPRAAEHVAGFTALHAAWREDFPNVERVYVVQVRAGCGGPSLELRDAQRRFAETLPMTTVMSATALDGHDGCHYSYENGYRELGERFARLLGRDLFDAPAEPDTEAVDVVRATISGDTIAIETRSDASAITVDPGAEASFIAAGRTIVSVRATGTNLEIALAPGGAPPATIAYDGHSGAGPWVTNANHVGLLAFTLPVE
jgi:PKD repeat protein